MSSKYIIIRIMRHELRGKKNVKYVSGEEVLSYIIKMFQFNTNDKESNKKIIKILEYTLLKRDK